MFFTPHLFTLRKSNADGSPRPGNAPQASGMHTANSVAIPHWSSLAHTLRTPKIWGQKLCIIPRAHCTFRRVAISNKSKPAQQAALLRLQTEAMHKNYQFKLTVDHDGNKAGAWEYENLGTIGYDGRSLPETLARLPHDQGPRLVQMIEGVEGQIWHLNNLIASRWWPTKPSQQNWSIFVHSLPGDLQQQAAVLPPIETVEFRQNLPHFEMSQERLTTVFSPRNMAMTCAIGLACIGTFLAAQYTRNSLALQRAISAQNELSDVAGKILSQRRRSIGNMKMAEKFTLIGHNGTLVLSVRDLANTLKDHDLVIKQLYLRDEEIEIELQGDVNISIPDLVAKLDEMPAFTDTSISLARQGVLIVKSDILSPHHYDTLPHPAEAKFKPAPVQNEVP